MNLSRLLRLKLGFAEHMVETRGDESDLKRLRDVQAEAQSSISESDARHTRGYMAVLGYSTEEIDLYLAKSGYRNAR